MFNRLCILGVGLIGGSIASAARNVGLCQEIIGVDSDRRNLQVALERGIVDVGVENVQQLDGLVDLVVLSTPVGSFGDCFEQLKPNWSRSTVYTDTGSTKENVIEAVGSIFGDMPPNFVPGHPITGGERSGAIAASANLFQNKRVILTPVAETDEQATERIEKFWRKIGGKVSKMEPHYHDNIFAATSHLPHVIAFSLVDMLGRKDEKDEILKYAAGGFRDFTRLASSDPKMWLDICMANREKIMPLVEDFRQELILINEMLEKKESEKLFETFQSAKNARQKFLEKFEVE